MESVAEKASCWNIEIGFAKHNRHHLLIKHTAAYKKGMGKQIRLLPTPLLLIV